MALPKTFAQAITLLSERLTALDAAGADGFEGLARDLLAHLTGQTFRIAKSGPQDGTDVRSASVNTVQIGLEAKRYGQTTTLALDALKAKLQEAAAQSDAVDLWVLAASREISATNVRALEQTGEAEGVKVLILDWSKKSGALPRLAALCAMVPDVMAIAFPKDAGVAAALPLIAAHPSYPAFDKALRDELAGADIGFSAATANLDAWMRDTLASEVKAQQRLLGFNDLLAPSTKLAHRTATLGALDDWWPPAPPFDAQGRGRRDPGPRYGAFNALRSSLLRPAPSAPRHYSTAVGRFGRRLAGHRRYRHIGRARAQSAFTTGCPRNASGHHGLGIRPPNKPSTFEQLVVPAQDGAPPSVASGPEGTASTRRSTPHSEGPPGPGHGWPQRVLTHAATNRRVHPRPPIAERSGSGHVRSASCRNASGRSRSWSSRATRTDSREALEPNSEAVPRLH